MRVPYLLLVLSCTFVFPLAANAVEYRGINDSCTTTSPCRSHLQCSDGYCKMPSFLSGVVKDCKDKLSKKGVDMRSYVSVYGGDGTGGYCYYECDGMYDSINAEQKNINHAVEVNAMLTALYAKNKSPAEPDTYLSPAQLHNLSGIRIEPMMGMEGDALTTEQIIENMKESARFPIIRGLVLLPKTLADAHGFHLTPQTGSPVIPGADKVNADDPKAVADFLALPATIEALEKVSAEAKAAVEKAREKSTGICGKCSYCVSPFSN